MIAAKNAYLAIKDDPAATRAQKEAAVQEVGAAFAGLRWRDTTYPDPHDLPALQTIPNAFTFFDKTKGTNGMVTNAAEWAERKQEILDLAQFYEYGYGGAAAVTGHLARPPRTLRGNLLQEPECSIHRAAVRKGLGHIWLQQNEIRPCGSLLVVLTPYAALHLGEIVFGAQIVTASLLHAGSAPCA